MEIIISFIFRKMRGCALEADGLKTSQTLLLEITQTVKTLLLAMRVRVKLTGTQRR